MAMAEGAARDKATLTQRLRAEAKQEVHRMVKAARSEAAAESERARGEARAMVDRVKQQNELLTQRWLKEQKLRRKCVACSLRARGFDTYACPLCLFV